jgi:peptide/nickel transport system permease protein
MAQHVTTAPSSGTATLPLEALDAAAIKKHRSLWNNAWRQFRHHHLAVAGLVLFLSFVFATVVGSAIYPRNKDFIDFMQSSLGPFESMKYPLGTDTLGRDILARLLWGGRISIAVGVITAFMTISIGTLVGAVAGFFGGFIDSLLMRITDLFISLPLVPILLMVSFLFRDKFQEWFDENMSAWGGGQLGIFVLIVLVLSLLSWMPTARLVRGTFLSIKEKEYVEAARSIGVSRTAIVFKHILPNALSPIIVAATLAVGAAIIGESTLSFLGLGFPSDVPTWGRMLFEAKDWLQLTPHEALIPGTVIFLTVLAINYIGDGLRDALDPRKTQ